MSDTHLLKLGAFSRAASLSRSRHCASATRSGCSSRRRRPRPHRRDAGDRSARPRRLHHFERRAAELG